MNVELKIYAGEQAAALSLIRDFWRCHNGWEPTDREALEDLTHWTAPGHQFFFIQYEGEPAGFLHLGSRGAKCDWLEDIFVLPQLQHRGIGRAAVVLAEKQVKEYSPSLYLEAAARNEGAIRLYHALGYNCLNTVTLRKDFHPETFTEIKTEQLHGMDFVVKKWNG